MCFCLCVCLCYFSLLVRLFSRLFIQYLHVCSSFIRGFVCFLFGPLGKKIKLKTTSRRGSGMPVDSESDVRFNI